LDLKFHDIPRTVAKATVEAARLGVSMVDVHALGGPEMLRHTVSEVSSICTEEHLAAPKILAVTVLTSLNGNDLQGLGIGDTVEGQVLRLARLARDAGAHGVVASPREIGALRKEFGKRFLIVTPGIRAGRTQRQDQKRVTTPDAAIRAGADYLVVGSPIWSAPDPVAAAREIAGCMTKGFEKPAFQSPLLAKSNG